MIFIGTQFCNLLEDGMRLHLQPRIDESTRDAFQVFEGVSLHDEAPSQPVEVKSGWAVHESFAWGEVPACP